MLFKKQEKRKPAVNIGKLERLVDEGMNKRLVWDTYVAATNMPDPDRQRLGLTLISVYSRSMSKLSCAYVALSGLIGGSVEMRKAISNTINPLSEIPYAPDWFTKAELLLLGTNLKPDTDTVPPIKEIYEAMHDYHQAEQAMARFAYQLLPEVVGSTTSELAPKRTDALDSLIKD